MKIDKAIKQAMREGKGIRRKTGIPARGILIPTNTPAGILMVPFKKTEPILWGWIPDVNDLVAKDWFVHNQSAKG
ncbi:Thoeris anti-defense Tad2 family protein [Furfurilactobacillus entadae]|uniref:Thoeris anti-defense Tad2 family protein n=1 Tax=Furfurilactobacillus entadae TaxID=2922307 RepID=UPI0035EFEB04